MSAKTKKAPKPEKPAAAGGVRTPAPGPDAAPAHPAEVPLQVDGKVPLKDIRPSPLNPRKTFPQASIDSLAASFRDHGITSRLLVRPIGEPGKTPELRRGQWVGLDHFELIDGERRYRAARQEGLAEVPVTVRWADDATALALMLVANDQREDVPPSEQAAGYARLAAMGKTLDEISATTGQPTAFVRAVLSLAKLPPWALAAVDAGTLPRATAELVARVPGEESRKRCAVRVLENRSPGMIDDAWCDARIKEFDKKGIPDAADIEPLSYRDTKELIRTHFQRQLKGAPFSLKVLYTPADLVGTGHERQIPSCDECPKRAGNDPEARAEGVRADVCLDPDCYRRKVAAYRQSEVEKAAAKGVAEVPEDFTWRMTFGEHPAAPKGWCLLDVPTAGTEIGEEFPPGKVPPLPLAKVLGKDCPQQYLAFHCDKPRLLVRTADARKALQAGGVLKKPERKPAEKPKRQVDEEWLRRAEEASPRPQAPDNPQTKPASPPLVDEVDELDRAAQIGAKVLGEMAADDCGDIDAAAVALRMVARFLIRDHCEFGIERRKHVALALGFDPDKAPSGDMLYHDAADKLSPAEVLGLCVRLAAAPVLEGEGGAKTGFAADLLEWGQMDWDQLRDQARRELAGGETADEKIDRAAAAMGAVDDSANPGEEVVHPEPAKALVLIGEVDDIPDAVLDLVHDKLRGGGTAKVYLHSVLADCEAMTAVLGLPLRNRLVTYFVKLGAKIKPAEQAAKAIADHVEGKAEPDPATGPVDAPPVKVGDVVKTDYGTGPYRVTHVSAYPKKGKPTEYSLTVRDAHGTDEKDGFLNFYARQPDGRIVADNGDELIVLPAGADPGPSYWEWLKAAGLLGTDGVQADREMQRRWFRGEAAPAKKAKAKGGA